MRHPQRTETCQFLATYAGIAAASHHVCELLFGRTYLKHLKAQEDLFVSFEDERSTQFDHDDRLVTEFGKKGGPSRMRGYCSSYRGYCVCMSQIGFFS